MPHVVVAVSEPGLARVEDPIHRQPPIPLLVTREHSVRDLPAADRLVAREELAKERFVDAAQKLECLDGEHACRLMVLVPLQHGLCGR